MGSEPTAASGYLPVPQEHHGVHIATCWWKARKGQVSCFFAKNTGLLLVICSQFVFASMNLSVKLLQTLDPPTPTIEVITLRMLISLGSCTGYMVANRIPDPFLGPKGVRGLLVIRALAGFFGIFGMYYALNYLSIADATIITFLGPFTTALAGRLLLGEAYTNKEALAGVCCLFGVVLIARPTGLFETSVEGGAANVTSSERLRAVGGALLSVCGNTGTYISMRAIGSRARLMHVMTFFSIFCVIVGFVAMATMHESMIFPMTWKWITLVLIVGFLSIAGQLLLTMGIRYETAARSSLGSYCLLLFSALLEFVVFGTVPSPSSAAGAAIIFAAQAYAVLSKQNLVDQPSVAPSPNDVGETRRLLGSDNVNTPQGAELPADTSGRKKR